MKGGKLRDKGGNVRRQAAEAMAIAALAFLASEPEQLGRFLAKGGQQPLVGENVVEHANEEVRLARRGANPLRADSTVGEEAAEPLGIRGDEAKRLNRQLFRRFLADRNTRFRGQIFAFP